MENLRTRDHEFQASENKLYLRTGFSLVLEPTPSLKYRFYYPVHLLSTFASRKYLSLTLYLTLYQGGGRQTNVQYEQIYYQKSYVITFLNITTLL